MEFLGRFDRHAPHALAALRIVTALLFIEHGTHKLLGFPPSEMPLQPLLPLSGIGGLLEVSGGLAVLAGLITRPVAIVLAGQMAAAYWFFHAPRGVFPIVHGNDSAILFCIVFLLLVFTGPGAWTIDEDARHTAAPRRRWTGDPVDHGHGTPQAPRAPASRFMSAGLC